VVHLRTKQKGRTTFGDHGAIEWTSTRPLPALGFLYLKKRGTRVSDTVVFLPEKYNITTTASADRASTALKELTEALKNPAAAKPFLNTGNKLNAAIKALTEILSKSKSTDAPKSEEKISPPRVSERTTTVRTPRVNTAQAGSPGSPLVENDPKLPMRGLNEIFSMRKPVILNSIKKTTSTPTKSFNNNNNINDNNNNNNNNSINGADTGTPGEENR
jgi:hypothetical protein